jgi:adsorption protein B
MRQVYWFWRDRKGLVGNLLSPLANLILLYAFASYLRQMGHPGVWHFGTHIPSWLQMDCRVTSLIALIQAGVRTQASARIYGWRFASAVPVRMCWGNLVNFVATAAALSDFAKARWKGRGMAWRKTEHIYPVPQLRLRPANFPVLAIDGVQAVLNHQILSVSSTFPVTESY